MPSDPEGAECSHGKEWKSPRWGRMLLKELREILRDRRTTITLVAMPLLIYPLLGVTLQKLIMVQATALSKTEYRIVTLSEDESAAFVNTIRRGHAIVTRQEGRSLNEGQEPAGTTDDPLLDIVTHKFEGGLTELDDVMIAIDADIGIQMKAKEERRGYTTQILYRPASALSCDARRFIERRLRAVNEEFGREILHHLNPPVELPLDVQSTPLLTTLSGVPSTISLATLVPLILILMTVTGAVYPAIDLTAGERERGTLEALVASPVPRHELLFAKFMAVLTVAVMTAVANLTSMMVTAYASGLESFLFGPAGLSLRLLSLTLGLLLVFAAFFSAVILILTSFARSFKEAQAYLIPLMLVSLAPGVVCLLPGIEFNAVLAVIPLANIVLLARDVFDNRVVPVWTLATILSTVLYAAVALGAAARIFGTDAVLYGSDGSWSDVFRRPEMPRARATLGQAMTGLAILFPSFLILSGVGGRMSDNVINLLTINAALTIALFAGLPLILTRLCGVRWRTGLSLRRPPVIALLLAAILGLSLWPMAYELVMLQTSNQMDLVAKKLFEVYKTKLNAIPLVWKLACLSIVPAVSEELFFRGFLQTSFREEMSKPLAVCLSSMLFGLFHVVVRDALFVERFAPSCFLGLILGTICLITRSVWPGIVLHSLHNGFLLIISNYVEELKSFGIGISETQHLPISWLITSAGVSISALAILMTTCRQTDENAVPAAVI